jgi:hypothetical protein
MEIILKRTNELSEVEISGICSLYKKVMKAEKTVDFFKNQFMENEQGYSYHSLVFSENNLVGSWSFIPVKFSFFGTVTHFALSVDTMIDREFKNSLAAISKMADLACKAIRADGIPAIYGFPNDNFFNMVKVLLKWKFIGKLDFYVLPMNLKAVSKKLFFLDPFVRIYAWFLNKISRTSSDKGDAASLPIEKVNDAVFNRYRYFGNYQTVSPGGKMVFTYIVGEYEGSRTCYLIDVDPGTKENIANAVKHIYLNHKKEIDILIYLSNRRTKPINLIRVPAKYEPKKVNLCGIILMPEKIDKRFYEIENWNANLSVFDVV